MIGKSISHYKIIEKIGSGGMSTGYKAILAENKELYHEYLKKYGEPGI